MLGAWVLPWTSILGTTGASGPSRTDAGFLAWTTELMEMAVETTATIALPEGALLQQFRPMAYFDEHMDCIRVVTHDRSVTEHRINGYYTVHECNHRGPLDPEYVGFTIKGVKSLFREVGIPVDGVYKLADVIDRLVKFKPGSVMSQTLLLIFRDYRMTGDLLIDFKHAA